MVLTDLQTPDEQTIATAEDVYTRWRNGLCERDTKAYPTGELHLCVRCGRVVCDDCSKPTRDKRDEPIGEADHSAYRSWIQTSEYLEAVEAELDRLHNLLVYEHGMEVRKQFFGLLRERIRAADGRPWAAVEEEVRAEIQRLGAVRQSFAHDFPIKFACVVRTSVDYRQSEEYASKYMPYLCEDCRTESDRVGPAPAQPKNLTTWED